ALIVFETEHVAGALHRALGAFAECGVNLSRIESRPAGGTPWRYRFLVQVEGDARREPLRSALRALRHRARSVRVLGSFRSA
ncbi:MAG TPA: ACT domain-containing protein, partial [Candidatus Binatia bacterium]|nr:ACT domain-containing protein [Candidatus Binatia bacterium]